MQTFSNIKEYRLPTRLKSFMRNAFLVEKLNNRIGFVVLALLVSGFSVLIAAKGLIAVILLLAAIIGIPIIYAVIAYPKFGIFTLIIGSYLLMWVIKMGLNFPMGTLMDGLYALLLLSFLLHQKMHPEWKSLQHPISYLLIVWILYNLLQVANPEAASRLSWLYTIRSVAIVALMFFVFLHFIRSIEMIRVIFKVWMALALFGALYALKQEYFGFASFENKMLQDPQIVLLYFIDGRWRKFSIFSDPVAFAYNMVVASLIAVVLLTLVKTWYKRLLLVLLIALCCYTLLFSGTRGAYVLIPAALVLFFIVQFNKRIMGVGIVAVAFIAALIFVPTTNPSLQRFQSAFKPAADASFNVRSANQKRIQPYILSHPIGGGLGATGVWGARFAPDSFLASFPPDSGYVRVAVELGWIGLIIFCVLMFYILKTGVNNYFAIQNKELKAYCLAMLLVVFAYNIGNYPQEAIVQFPSNILFYLAAALIVRTRLLDQELQNEKMHHATEE